jgi:hypothetical protein
MMARYVRGPLAYTWLALSFATLMSWLLGAKLPLLVLAIAIIKCRIVIRSYMEVRLAPSWLQRTCDAWLALNFAMGSSYYWLVR